VTEDFDIGSLLWVKDEINQSLDAVLDGVSNTNGHHHDASDLRFSLTYLYQVSGALDMIGLEGCKHYCNQLEKFAVKLEKKELALTPENRALFINTIIALKTYLQRLLDGAADLPSRLHPELEPLVIAMGETIDESELFFPDINPQVPNEVLSKKLSDDEYTATMLQQRATYQKSLLIWMQTQSEDAVSAMHNALSEVVFAQHNKRIKTLWWAASAFIETLKSPRTAADVAAKKVCRKLDQALRQLVVGENRPNNQLLRDVLYFVANSDIETDTIEKVKSVFSLGGMFDKQTSAGSAIPLSAHSLNDIEGLKVEFKSLHDIWQEVSNSIGLEKVGTNSDAELVELNNVLITQFADKLHANRAVVTTLNPSAFVDCYLALEQASVVLRDNQKKATQGALVEIASALSLLNAALTSDETLDSEMVQRLTSEAELLQSIETGLDYRQQKAVHEARLDKETIAAVVKDIHHSLKVVEQSLDTFFRNPSDKATLSLTSKPLKQLAAIFDMLNLPVPMQVVKACDHYVQYFQQDDYDENQADFELLAESLATVGLYAAEMPKVRAETTTALEGDLATLNKALLLIDVAFEDVATTEDEGSSFATMEASRQGENNEAEILASADIADTGEVEQLLDQAFDEELLDIYLTEAEEIIAHIAQSLQSLRVNATVPEPLLDIRRNYHTLKGSGKTVGLLGQATIASDVEQFLNGVLEQESSLNPKQIAQLEKITAAFADWTTELRSESQVLIHQSYWLRQVRILDQLQTSLETKNKAQSVEGIDTQQAYVLISGKHKLSRQLYELFLNESMQHLVEIEQDIAKLKENKKSIPGKHAKQAVHTLASNALSSGFKPMGELCRALEHWLDNVSWVPTSLVLYENATKAIARMWQSISKLKMPRTARTLIKLLNDASEQAAVKQIAQEEKAVDSNEFAIDEDLPVVEKPELIEASLPVQASAAIADEFDAKYVNAELLAMFVEEANILLPEVGTALRAWKMAPEDKQYSDVLQRLLHTLKGSARMAGQAEIGDIVHGFEDIVLQKTEETPSANDFETMFIALDNIVGFFDQTMLNDVVESGDGSSLTTHHIQPANRLANQAGNFLRIREEVLDQLINDAGEVSIIRSRIDRELIGFKAFSGDLTDSISRLRSYLRELEIEAEMQMQSRINILQESNETFDPLEFDRFTRLQELTRMLAESVSDVGIVQSGLLANLSQTEAALQQQSRMSRDLQQGLLGLRMLPFQHVSERMQRIVRQTARELNKSVDLVIEGGTTKIDRGVLDKVSAPLEHLLRNAVAHGIERKADRAVVGKPETGVIRLLVRTANDEIQLTLSDDGAGVDLEKVREKAILKGLLQADIKATEDTLLSVIFEPGFSTESEITQISGRGVGLDVVRNDISGLGGRVDMSSEAGKGTVFNIYVPVTQSVAQVLMVRAGSHAYALPVAMIEQAQKIKHHDLMATYDAGKVQWSGADYPIVHLAQLLNLPEYGIEEQPYASVLLLRNGLHTVALHVDEVIGNQEVVMKEIGTQLARVPGIVGATVTGDGDIILIVNPVLILNRSHLVLGSISVKNVSNKVKKPRALIVDDSLTMRKVLARLLEREGYEVQVAKDGLDAMEMLKVTTPDIVLTDIEMPRLDGFGLARNIRDDARTIDTPLIMISSRTADKHKKLAKEIGVDAFFGKPVQDEELIAEMKLLLKSKK
jgi:chemosensory pili system protein ChpA (sensor histidine kinase/response regulator)